MNEDRNPNTRSFMVNAMLQKFGDGFPKKDKKKNIRG